MYTLYYYQPLAKIFDSKEDDYFLSEYVRVDRQVRKH